MGRVPHPGAGRDDKFPAVVTVYPTVRAQTALRVADKGFSI